MPRRKRRFETLEDRRLLAALVGPMTPAQSANAAGLAPSSAATSPAIPVVASGSVASGADQDSGEGDDDSDEYASPASPDAASPASAGNGSSYGYGSSSQNGSSYNYPPNTTDPYSSSKTSSASRSATQASEALLLAEEATAARLSVLSVLPLGLSLPAIGPGPSASASPPAARSPSALVTLEDEAGAASIAAEGSGSVAQTDLVAPVALASSASDFDSPGQAGMQTEELTSEAVTPAPEIHSGTPIAGSSAINFAAIEQGIDDVFDRIERLGDELVGAAGATRFAEWLVIAGGASAVVEYARIRFREATQWQQVNPWPVPYEGQLRRRWLRARKQR